MHENERNWRKYGETKKKKTVSPIVQIVKISAREPLLLLLVSRDFILENSTNPGAVMIIKQSGC